LRIVEAGEEIRIVDGSEPAADHDVISTIRRAGSSDDFIVAAEQAVAALTKVNHRPDDGAGDSLDRAGTPEQRPAQTNRDTQTSSSRKDGVGLRWQLGVGAGAGLLLRAGGPDSRYEGTLQLARAGFGARLEADLVSSNSRGGSLSVTEWSWKLGPRWYGALGPKTTIGVGLLAGIVLHHFNYGDRDEGSVFGGAVALPLDISHRLGSSFALTVSVAPAYAAPNREHEVLGSTAWKRSNHSLALTAGLRVLP
jgi:hypothetical protein